MSNLQNVDKSKRANNKGYLIDVRNSLIKWFSDKGMNNQQIGSIFNIQRSSVAKILKHKSKSPQIWIKVNS